VSIEREMSRVEILKNRHQELDDEVDKMSAMRYLSPKERLHLKGLKVMRLRCRDAISSLAEKKK
jgi:hypothetical protein